MTRKDEPAQEQPDDTRQRHRHEHHHPDKTHFADPEPLEASLDDVIDLFELEKDEDVHNEPEVDYGAPPPG
jgi:hypothetical protein